jgi:hypothetical protein
MSSMKNTFQLICTTEHGIIGTSVGKPAYDRCLCNSYLGFYRPCRYCGVYVSARRMEYAPELDLPKDKAHTRRHVCRRQ